MCCRWGWSMRDWLHFTIQTNTNRFWRKKSISQCGMKSWWGGWQVDFMGGASHTSIWQSPQIHFIILNKYLLWFWKLRFSICDEELVGRLAGRFYGELPSPSPPPLQHHHPTSTVQTKLQFLAPLLHTIQQHNDIDIVFQDSLLSIISTFVLLKNVKVWMV